MERNTAGVSKQRNSSSRDSKRDKSSSLYHSASGRLPDPQKIKQFLNKMKLKTQEQGVISNLSQRQLTTITTEQAEDDLEIVQLRNTLAPKTPTIQAKAGQSQQFSKFKFTQQGKPPPVLQSAELQQSASKGFLGKVSDWIEKLESSQPKKRGQSSTHSRNLSNSSQAASKRSTRVHPLAASTSHIKSLFTKPTEHKRDPSLTSLRSKPPQAKPGALINQGQVTPRAVESKVFANEGSSQKNFSSSHRSSYAHLGFGVGNGSGLTREDIVVENELIKQKIAQLQRNLAKEALQRRFWQEKYHDLESKYNERIMNKVRNSTPGPLTGSVADQKSRLFVDDVKLSLPTRATGDSSRKSR